MVSQTPAAIDFSLVQKFLFWFCVFYFGLHTFPFPLQYIPGADVVFSYYEGLWDSLVQWGGRTFFGINEITIKPNGSGDTTFNWVQTFLVFCFSLIAATLVVSLKSKRINYPHVQYWFGVYVRYYLAFTMLSYGFAKVFPSQFGTLSEYRLWERVGDMSPMGMLWTFMAASVPYQVFSGMAEVVAGTLLFFRRTTTLGAFICIGVMANIFALNMFYDVPVKLYSFLLLLMGVYLAGADFKRLWNFFVMNRPTQAQNLQVFSDKKWFRIGRITLKTLLIGGAFATFIIGTMSDFPNDEKAKKEAIFGMYEVTQYSRNNQTTLANDTLRWQEVFLSPTAGKARIYISNDFTLRERLFVEINRKAHTMQPDTTWGTEKVFSLQYQQPDSTHLIIKGLWGTDSVYAQLQKKQNKKFLLTTRGFHWVNERPFNR